MLQEIRRLSKLEENKSCVDCPEKVGFLILLSFAEIFVDALVY
jgi:hypothetical protein